MFFLLEISNLLLESNTYLQITYRTLIPMERLYKLISSKLSSNKFLESKVISNYHAY